MQHKMEIVDKKHNVLTVNATLAFYIKLQKTSDQYVQFLTVTWSSGNIITIQFSLLHLLYSNLV